MARQVAASLFNNFGCLTVHLGIPEDCLESRFVEHFVLVSMYLRLTSTSSGQPDVPVECSCRLSGVVARAAAEKDILGKYVELLLGAAREPPSTRPKPWPRPRFKARYRTDPSGCPIVLGHTVVAVEEPALRVHAVVQTGPGKSISFHLRSVLTGIAEIAGGTLNQGVTKPAGSSQVLNLVSALAASSASGNHHLERCEVGVQCNVESGLSGE